MLEKKFTRLGTSQTTGGQGSSIMDFQRKDAVEVLVKCILQSSPDALRKEIDQNIREDQINQATLRDILIQIG